MASRELSMGRRSGFTLIEVILAVVTTTALSALIFVEFVEYKVKSNDLTALNDLKNFLVAEESYFYEKKTYVDCGSPVGAKECEQILPGFRRTDDVQIWGFAAKDHLVKAFACHNQGSKSLSKLKALTWYYASEPLTYSNGEMSHIGSDFPEDWNVCVENSI